MKLTRLYLDQFRQYRNPMTLNQFEPGLNVIHGPNESGKSTLVHAIQAAFFERYSTGTVKDVQPWGDSGARPTVELDFEHNGETIQLKKRFLKDKRCDLRVGNRTLSGEEAEDWLAGWLGYDYAGRGASKPEHWGVPGLLWVEQGTGQDLRAPVQHAQEHLEGALDNLLGDVASTGGDDLIHAVQVQRARVLTSTGKARGEYRQAGEDLEAERARQQELRQAVQGYRSEVDTLGRQQQLQAREEQERPWEAAERSLAEAQQRYDAIREQLERQEQLQERLAETKKQQEFIDQQWQAYRARTDELAERERQKQQAEEAFTLLERQNPALQEEEEKARQALAEARQQQELARQLGHRRLLEKQQTQLEQSRQRQATERDQAQAQQTRVQALRRQAEEYQVDNQALQALEETEKALHSLQIRKEAIATRLEWDLPDDQRLALGNGTDTQDLTGRDERLLLAAATLTLENGGRLTITPGGQDADRLRRQLEDQEQALTRELGALGVASVAAARQQARDAEQVTQELRLQQQLLQQLAPDGLDTLADQHRSTEREMESVRQQLAELPPLPADIDLTILPEENAARAAAENAENWLQEAEIRRREHERALEEARHTRSAAQREWQQLRDRLASAEHRTLGQKLETQRAEQARVIQSTEQKLEACQQAIDAARPDLAEQDIERYRRTATTRLQQYRDREIEIHRLQSALQARGAQGLEEALAEQEGRVARIEKRYSELERRARALDLLFSLLNDKRQALIARLQAPLQERLDHYLTMLFPRARLEINQALQPDQFEREGNQGALNELSFGAREQLGLISRLAYADLLRDAGKPTLIILDDSLVHSDSQRLDAMKRVLFDAATRHQVLIFTCHPENYQDLGVAPMDLEVLKAQSD